MKLRHTLWFEESFLLNISKCEMFGCLAGYTSSVGLLCLHLTRSLKGNWNLSYVKQNVILQSAFLCILFVSCPPLSRIIHSMSVCLLVSPSLYIF